MSYHSTGAGGAEYGLIAPTVIQRPAAQIRAQRLHSGSLAKVVNRAGTRTGYGSVGACCSSCSQDGLGASFSMVTPSTTPNVPLPPNVRLPPGALPPGMAPPSYPGAMPVAGMSPMVKLALIAGLGVGGFLLIRRLRARKAP